MKRMVLLASAVALLAFSALANPAHARSARVLLVPRDYPSVQAAVDHAAPGDTVVVGPGTYVEELVVGHDVTIRGAGPGATVIKAPAAMSSYGVHLPDGRVLSAVVRVDLGARVRMSGLTVTGPIPCGREVTGILALRGAHLDLSRVRVTGIHADPATCAPDDAAGRAIVYGTPAHIEVGGERGTSADGRLDQVRVDHFQHAGISVAGTEDRPSRVSVVHSAVSGGWTLPSFQADFWIDAGSVVDLRDNLVRGAVCGGDFCGPDPIFEAQGIGILLLSLRPGTQVVGNRITGNDVGITQVLSPGCCRITGNTLLDNHFFGLIIQDGDGSARGNRIAGGRVGVGVVADAADTTARLYGNSIRRTSAEPVRTVECCGYSARALIR